MRQIVTKLRWMHLTPVLALIALMAWSLASPMGASPDDDFHLTSTWCATVDRESNCQEGTAEYNRVVPEVLLESACYLPDARTSAGCQSSLEFDATPIELTERGNFVGGYPPLYYATMGLFVGPDILASVVAMRVATSVLFVALTTALFALLPLPRRSTLVWSWLVTTVPLGVFLIASNNPSSWAVIGVGSAWLALLGWFETTGRRRVGLGILFGVAVLVAAGARGDAAVYVALGIAVVLALKFTPTKKFFIEAILPVAFVIVCVFFFVSAQQTVSSLGGFGGAGSTSSGEPRDTLGLLAFNLLNVPTLWAGVFGTWGLGWLEVGMPGIVAFGSLACFIVIATVGIGRLSLRKGLALGVVGTALIALPVFVLTRGGDLVGEEVQPRYLLPLIVFFAGLLLLSARGRAVTLTGAQTILIVGTLSVVQFVALHTTMRRYITGVDDQGWNLNAGMEWWWDISLSPMLVLVSGSLAYAGLVSILAWEVTRGRSSSALPSTVKS